MRIQGFGRPSWSERQAAVGLLIPLLCLLLAACGGDPRREATHDAGGHGEGTDLFVVKSGEKGMPISEDLFEQIQSFDHVLRVEKYIRLRMEAFDVVGVEPGAPLRIMTGQPDLHLIEAELAEGTELKAGDADSGIAFVGELYAQAVGAETGGPFRLGGPEYELVVAGRFSTDPASLSRAVIMPLALVQKIYGLRGLVTHFWVTVDSPDQTHDVIRAIQLALGESVQVLPRTHS